MRILRNILTAAAGILAAALLPSCDEKAGGDSFSFRLEGASGVTPKVTLVIEKGPKDGYSASTALFLCDLVNDTFEQIDWPYGLPTGVDLAFPSKRKDYIIEGLPAGTYKVMVSLTRDDITLTRSALFVAMADTPEEPETPEEPAEPEDPSDPGNPGGTDTSDEAPAVQDFTMPTVDSLKGRLAIADGETLSFTPEVTPADARKVFTVKSSDDEVADVKITSGGEIRITALRPGYANISVTADNGPTKVLPLTVYKEVTVTTDFYELEATETQLKTKTFPSYIRFSSDSEDAFDIPIAMSVSMKAVVVVSGKDSRTVTDSRTVYFHGNRTAYYDIASNILIPAWMIYRTTDFHLSLTLSIQRSSSLDPDLWKITYRDTYKNQEGTRIGEYLTDILQ